MLYSSYKPNHEALFSSELELLRRGERSLGQLEREMDIPTAFLQRLRAQRSEVGSLASQPVAAEGGKWIEDTLRLVQEERDILRKSNDYLLSFRALK